MANRNLPIAMLLGGLSVNLNHLKNQKLTTKKVNSNGKAVQLWKEKFSRLWKDDPRFKIAPKHVVKSDRFLIKNGTQKAKRKYTKRNRKVNDKSTTLNLTPIESPCNLRERDNSDNTSVLKTDFPHHVTDNSPSETNQLTQDELTTLENIMTDDFMNNILQTDSSMVSDDIDLDVFDTVDRQDNEQDNNHTLTGISMEDIPITQVPMPDLNSIGSKFQITHAPSLPDQNSKFTPDPTPKPRKRRQHNRLKFVNYYTDNETTTRQAYPSQKSIHHPPKVPQLLVSTSFAAQQSDYLAHPTDLHTSTPTSNSETNSRLRLL